MGLFRKKNNKSEEENRIKGRGLAWFFASILAFSTPSVLIGQSSSIQTQNESTPTALENDNNKDEKPQQEGEKSIEEEEIVELGDESAAKKAESTEKTPDTKRPENKAEDKTTGTNNGRNDKTENIEKKDEEKQNGKIVQLECTRNMKQYDENLLNGELYHLWPLHFAADRNNIDENGGFKGFGEFEERIIGLNIGDIVIIHMKEPVYEGEEYYALKVTGIYMIKNGIPYDDVFLNNYQEGGIDLAKLGAVCTCIAPDRAGGGDRETLRYKEYSEDALKGENGHAEYAQWAVGNVAVLTKQDAEQGRWDNGKIITGEEIWERAMKWVDLNLPGGAQYYRIMKNPNGSSPENIEGSQPKNIEFTSSTTPFDPTCIERMKPLAPHHYMTIDQVYYDTMEKAEGSTIKVNGEEFVVDEVYRYRKFEEVEELSSMELFYILDDVNGWDRQMVMAKTRDKEEIIVLCGPHTPEFEADIRNAYIEWQFNIFRNAGKIPKNFTKVGKGQYKIDCDEPQPEPQPPEPEEIVL